MAASWGGYIFALYLGHGLWLGHVIFVITEEYDRIACRNPHTVWICWQSLCSGLLSLDTLAYWWIWWAWWPGVLRIGGVAFTRCFVRPAARLTAFSSWLERWVPCRCRSRGGIIKIVGLRRKHGNGTCLFLMDVGILSKNGMTWDMRDFTSLSYVAGGKALELNWHW